MSWRYASIAFACAAVLAAVHHSDLHGSFVPTRYFLPLHIGLELSSIVISLAVFITGWFGYRQSRNPRDLVIGLTFFATGVVDFIHTLSYKGMPDFLGQNTPGGAAAYWLVARLLVGVGLLIATFVRATERRRRYSPWLMLAGVGAFALGAIAIIAWNQQAIGTALYPQIGHPPSLLKGTLEYVTIGLYLATFLLLTEKRGWSLAEVRGLRSALIFAIFAEVAFTLYTSPFAWMNGLGHLYKSVSYIIILNALFVAAVSKPYEQLSRARDELQNLYTDAQRHRQEMERSFASVGSALSSSLDLNEALDLIADLLGQMLHVDCSVVVSMHQRDLSAQLTSQRGGCHSADRPRDLAIEAGKDVIRDRKSMLVSNLQETGRVTCDFGTETCLRSMICAPMIHRDEALGVLAVYSHRFSAFDDGDVRLLEGFASHAAVAVYNAVSFEREARIADVLQRTLLGRPDISAGRFEIAQVYQPAMTEALVGGDFYDLYHTADGRLALVIGDVAGKGLKAAVHTALVKYSLRAYLEEGHSPSQSLKLLNNAICRSAAADTFITIFVGLLDTVTGELVYANGGHEPPVYSCDGAFSTLLTTGPVAGVWTDAEYSEGQTRLEMGCVLLLYTDGVSEARRKDEFLGVEGIGELLRNCEDMNSEDVARCVHRAAVDFCGGELRDDAAIVAIKARSQPVAD